MSSRSLTMFLPRVPPDAAASPKPVRPRVCKSDSSTDEKASPQKLSRPQKRRRRMQLLAACRAVAAAQTPPEDAADLKNGHVTAIQDSDRMAAVESKLDKILAIISLTFHPAPNAQGPTRNASHQMELLLHSFKADAGKFGATDKPLNPDAPSFIPHHVTTAVAATRIQRIFRGFRSRRKFSVCLKCKGAESGQCWCHEILCLGCFKSADDCLCSQPIVRHMECRQCGTTLTQLSLHTDEFYETPVRIPRSCVECNSNQICHGEWVWLSASDHRCDKCHRRDNQTSMVQCDGVACQGGLFHKTCLTLREHQDYPHGAHLCDDCIDLGIEPYTEAASDTVSDRSEGEDEGDDMEMQNSSSDGDDSINGSKWPDEEILIWTQVTLRMLDALPSSEESQAWLHRRWMEAKQHIPSDKVSRIQGMFETRFGTDLSE